MTRPADTGGDGPSTEWPELPELRTSRPIDSQAEAPVPTSYTPETDWPTEPGVEPSDVDWTAEEFDLGSLLDETPAVDAATLDDRTIVAEEFDADWSASRIAPPNVSTNLDTLAPTVPTKTADPIVEPTTADTPKKLSPRFEFAPLAENEDAKTTFSRRFVQGAVLLGLVAAIASFIVIFPEDDTTSVESTAGRIETVDKPIATADLLTSASSDPIEGSLGDAGGLRSPTGFATAVPGSPAEDGEGFAAAIADVVDDGDSDQPTTTTTAWVEPAIPPESEWVDAGNGFAVPDVLLRIRFCESTNNYNAANANSTARGAYQFLNGSWDWYGHAARTGVAEAHLATPAQQDESALLTLQAQGTSPWLASRSCWAADDIDPRYATAAPRPVTTTTTMDPSSTTVTSIDESSTTTTSLETTTTTTTPDSSSTTDTTVDDSTTSTTDDSTTTTSDDSTTTTS